MLAHLRSIDAFARYDAVEYTLSLMISCLSQAYGPNKGHVGKYDAYIMFSQSFTVAAGLTAAPVSESLTS
jgi:hypothetical protein